MNFLTAVKTLYPDVFIRTIDINNEIRYSLKSIQDLFQVPEFTLVVIPRNCKSSLFNYQSSGCFTTTDYLTDEGIEWALNTFKQYDNIPNKIWNAMTMVSTPILKHQEVKNTSPPVKLTATVLRKQIEAVFPNDLFIYDMNVAGKYTCSMYMLKYNIAFELPGTLVDPAVRLRIAEKTGTCCIQVHDESTFGGDIVSANLDFANAIGVALLKIKERSVGNLKK